MLNITDNNITSPVRTIKAKVELLGGSTFSYNDYLQEVTIERVGEEGKFFGFGVCQKLNIKLRDIEREIEPSTDNAFKVYFATGEDYITNFPIFYETEANREETTNALSITAYDLIKEAEKHTVAELELTSYTIREFAAAVAAYFELTLEIQGLADKALFDLSYEEGANFEGTETIREALNAIAEATQTIYFVTADKLIFKQLAILAPAALTITKADYISLDTKENRRLQAICSTNELGDSTTASISAIGTTQFIRNNPFLELREDIADILNKAIAAIGGLTINQFTCSWRGNYLLEIGDKISLVTKDNSIVNSYILNDTISYNGSFTENTQWSYTDNSETASNPTTLGEAIKQTYARVNKADKEITLLTSEVSKNSGKISELAITTAGISASVSEDIDGIRKEVSSKMDSDKLSIEIQKELENGVDKVTTSTGFIFDEQGLFVEKSGSEMKTQITEDGMKVFKNSEEMLTANNTGVIAVNLHAKTYLIIGNNSRLEDYGNRTGCFWIGG